MSTAKPLTFDELPDVLTVEDFARFARIGRRQAYEAVSRGEIYGRRIGRSIRIPKLAVRRWLDGAENENDAQPQPLRVVVGGTHEPRHRPARA